MDKILQDHPKLLLVFKQPGCPSCETLDNIIAEVSPQLEDLDIAQVELAKGEMECDVLADSHDIKMIPTLVYYQNGKKIKTIADLGPAEEVKKALLEMAQGLTPDSDLSRKEQTQG